MSVRGRPLGILNPLQTEPALAEPAADEPTTRKFEAHAAAADLRNPTKSARSQRLYEPAQADHRFESEEG